MLTVTFFLHMVGTAALGFYLILPFVVGGIQKLSLAAQEGAVNTVRVANRFAQYGLVLQLLTGGYMMSQGDYSVPWMIIVTILLLAMFAIGGIMSKPLKSALAGIREKKEVKEETSKLGTLSALLALLLLVMIFFMVYSHII
ncbi:MULTISPECIES: hypothetical protein [Paenibacillus]|jgi:hypothetical protein|uniref:Integral membrane protein n=2 Tax=Paenibacillus lactis TaxID=228574 RepID=G4H8C3_9BACL|nr:hypothetical protein [Paenibacillus lactis]EHB68108.1 hypothetical protein PaelaDRAFT_0234 [Paenibacillus lactis 154]MBP1892141.1 hypothetical protein [Paenibacillus lactis]MCM3492826.1 hypothetical protein [Paenibacillus lactis]GIO89594.1 hypothetical protein J31TS3_08210 [Paenibacillus lactis]HAF98965.1 hypothetical protein [Paenibacillus lactis]